MAKKLIEIEPGAKLFGPPVVREPLTGISIKLKPALEGRGLIWWEDGTDCPLCAMFETTCRNSRRGNGD
jgi:hypothetical protein